MLTYHAGVSWAPGVVPGWLPAGRHRSGGSARRDRRVTQGQAGALAVASAAVLRGHHLLRALPEALAGLSVPHPRTHRAVRPLAVRRPDGPHNRHCGHCRTGYVEHPIRTQTFRIPRPSLTLPLTMTSLAAVVLVATTGVRDLDRPSSPDRQGRVRHAAANRRRPPTRAGAGRRRQRRLHPRVQLDRRWWHPTRPVSSCLRSAHRRSPNSTPMWSRSFSGDGK